MSRAAIGLLLIVSCTAATAGETRRFPYEAVVTQETQVRSGPGKQKFYATGQLQAGEKVQVRRHDPGGWYMIAPPQGSFSWIPAKFVDLETVDLNGRGDSSASEGTVNANNTLVYVGSAQSDAHEISQRRLNKDDRVRIMGEKMLAGESGSETWYQIEPPQYEWRWVMGQHLATPDQLKPSKSAAVQPAEHKVAREITVKRVPAEPAPMPALIEQATSRQQEMEAATAGVEQEQRESVLAPLDAEYRRQLALPPAEQDLAELEEAYSALRAGTEFAELQAMIDHRLSAIGHQRRIADEAKQVAEVQQVTSEADRRMADLVAQQMELERRLANPIAARAPTLVPVAQRAPTPALAPQMLANRPQFAPTPTPTPVPVPTPVQPAMPLLAPTPVQAAMPVQAAIPTPVPVGPASPVMPRLAAPDAPNIEQMAHSVPSPTEQPQAIEPQPAAAMPQLSAPAPTAAVRLHPRFDGAGIVQRAPAGAPTPFVLITPQGKILAFLAPQNIDLSSWVGKAAGVRGRRGFRPEWRTDEIAVSGLEQVRLQ